MLYFVVTGSAECNKIAGSVVLAFDPWDNMMHRDLFGCSTGPALPTVSKDHGGASECPGFCLEPSKSLVLSSRDVVGANTRTENRMAPLQSTRRISKGLAASSALRNRTIGARETPSTFAATKFLAVIFAMIGFCVKSLLAPQACCARNLFGFMKADAGAILSQTSPVYGVPRRIDFLAILARQILGVLACSHRLTSNYFSIGGAK